MKIFNRYSHVFAIIGILTLQISCKKSFLEIIPKGQQIATSTKDYEQILNANYIVASTAGVFMGDEMVALKPFVDEYALRAQRLFRYADRIYEIDQVPDELNSADGYIRRLYLFNKVINEVMNSQGGSEGQKRALLAEAKAGRAICNFMLLSDFSTPYLESAAPAELGIPRIEKSDVTQTDFHRLNKQDSYAMVVKDLTEAIPDLSRLTHRRKISKLAAYFYLARVYMTMQNFNAAKEQLDQAFLEIPKAKVPLQLYDYNVVLDPEAEGTWFPLLFGVLLAGQPLSYNNTQVIYNIEVSAVSYVGGQANAFVMSPQTVSLFDASDKRLNLFDPIEFNGSASLPLGMRHPIGFSTQVGASLPDLYLMRAECNARANNLAEAVADLETLRSKRTGTPKVNSTIASNQQALVRFILDERVREFTYTGLRWLDMRRLSVDPLYRDHVKLKHEVRNNTTGAVVETHTLRPERFALKFGERVLRDSRGLEENP